MRRSAAWGVMALALGVMILVPRAAVQAQDAREGPREIEKCQTIGKPGSYRLVNNLVATGGADCLVITADFVTIDLAGFSISGTSGQGKGIIERMQCPAKLGHAVATNRAWMVDPEDPVAVLRSSASVCVRIRASAWRSN